MNDRDDRWGWFLLEAHGWRYDEFNMVMKSPNGCTLKRNEFFRMADQKFAQRSLERGGTPFSLETMKNNWERRRQ
jgi:hypothetical protein